MNLLDSFREGTVPKIPPGVRVRWQRGKFETREKNDPRWYFVEGWIALPWAETLYGTTLSDLEAQGGVDWKSIACYAWCVPDFATGVQWDGWERPSWVRSSLLDVIGYAQAREDQLEMFTASVAADPR